MKCQCGYEWKTKSVLYKVTCPSCGHKVLNDSSDYGIAARVTNAPSRMKALSYEEFCEQWKNEPDDEPMPTKEEYYAGIQESPTERIARMAMAEAELRKDEE